jgi:outer membrane protein OmpA-like peptidoglycan-associated protein
MYTQGIGLNDIYITRFDYNGNISWSKKYGTRSDDRGIDAAEAFDGTLLILANSSENQTQDITLMRLSEEGDKIWLRRYKSKGVLNAHRLITLRDNHFLTSISYYDKRHQEQTRLLKFDLQKNLLQEHNITTDGSNIISDIKERSNGAIVGVGHHTTKLKTEAMAITLDNHLRPIWERFFNNYERSKFNALTLLHDGKIAIAGELTDRGSEITNMWIIKLNCDGSTAQISLKSDTLYAKLLEIFADEIKTKQLSIDESLTIKLISPNLNFKVGEYRLDTQQSKFLQTFNNKLINLLYSYKDDIKTLHVNGHTSSEWGGFGVDKGYLKNMDLSSKRALSVAQFLYTKQKSEDKKEFLRDILSSDAHSYAQRVIDKTENKKASRRVDFKIELK